MKKLFFSAFSLFFSVMVFCQTPAQSFQCKLVTAEGQSISSADVSRFITLGDYEKYRLQNQRVTLKFDNGFNVELFSAQEIQASGLIKNASAYQPAFPAGYHMPVFHMTADGKVSAAYPITQSKYYSNSK